MAQVELTFTGLSKSFDLTVTFSGTIPSGTVTSISGTVGSAAVTGLAGGYGGDQLISATSPYVDFNGLAFSVGSTTYILYNSNSGVAIHIFNGSTGPAASLSATVLSCYLRGTRLATPDGPVPVENLRIGDYVQTLSGASRPITWIGHRDIDAASQPQPHKVWPIRIAAHSFAENQPERDLFLSPDHAIFVDDHLVPIKELINGYNIHPVPVARASYYHVELETHDIVLAERLPAESFLESGNRGAFANAEQPVHLHPHFAPLSWETACAPLLIHGPALDAIRLRLAPADPHAMQIDGIAQR